MILHHNIKFTNKQTSSNKQGKSVKSIHLFNQYPGFVKCYIGNVIFISTMLLNIFFQIEQKDILI